MQGEPGFCYWTDQVREALARKPVEERSDTCHTPQSQKARVGPAVLELPGGSAALGSRSWEPETQVQQIPSRCVKQHQRQLTVPQLLPRARASAAQLRSRSTGRAVPFCPRLTFLMRVTICACGHQPKLLLKPTLQRALRQSNLAFLALCSAVYLAGHVQSLSQVSFSLPQSFAYTVCAPLEGSAR